MIGGQTYRLAYLVSHPIQYEVSLLRLLASHSEIDLTVFFSTTFSLGKFYEPGFGRKIEWDRPLLGGYTHIFLPPLEQGGRSPRWRPRAYKLWRCLSAGRFDALWLHGYALPINVAALAMAKCLGIRVLLRGESHLRSHPRSRAKVWIKDRIFPHLFRAVDGFLAIGTRNREYYLHYGVPERRIFSMPYAVDNSFFQQRSAEARPFRDSLRAELGLELGRPVILFASKFQRRKRARDLLEAYIHLSPDGVREPVPYLLFIGDGEERARLQARAGTLGWSSVKFLGFKNQPEMPRYYDLCDLFVLPSEHEPWGLVVNEVMNAGKAVILSDQVGAGRDLVEDDQNGFVVPVGDTGMLADRLRRLTGDAALARRMGDESLKRIAEWNFEADLRGLLQAVEIVVG